LTGIVRVDAINARIQPAVDTVGAGAVTGSRGIFAFWSRDYIARRGV